MRKDPQKGFTLMELMVVIVIVAILAAVAVPLYINYVRDAQRTEAKGAIGAVVTAEQTHFQRYGTYVTDTFVKNPDSAGGQTLNCDLTEALNNWNIEVTSADADGFIVSAVGINNADGLCVTYTYVRAGLPAGTDPWNETCAAAGGGG